MSLQMDRGTATGYNNFMLIPYSDNLKNRKLPLVTWILLAINVYVYMYQVKLGMNYLPDMTAFIDRFGFTPADLTDPGPLGYKVLPLYTHMFLHANILHLLGNMLYLWIFADNVEDRLGSYNFLLFYLLSGFAAAGTHYFMNPHSSIIAVGASGAIAGVMGAYFAMFGRAKISAVLILLFFWKKVEISAFWFLGFWFLYQLWMSSASQGTHLSNVAFGAHIGGFITGLILCLWFAPARRQA
jgi:membrane associated rhomboid family serine protease